MGEFRIKVGPRVYTVPNMLHREGSEWLWATAFEGAGTIDKFVIGLTGWEIPDDPTRRPDHTDCDPLFPAPWADGMTPDTFYAEVVWRPGGNPGGSWNDSHLGLMGNMGEKEVTFSEHPTNKYVLSTDAVFKNQIPWAPLAAGECGGWVTDGVQIPDKSPPVGTIEVGGTYPLHDFPWASPLYWPGEMGKSFSFTGTACDEASPPPRTTPLDHWGFYVAAGGLPIGMYIGHRIYVTDTRTCTYIGTPWTVDEITENFVLIWGAGVPAGISNGTAYYVALRQPGLENATGLTIEANPWRGTSFPIRAAYLAAVDGLGAKKLIASCVFTADVCFWCDSNTLEVSYASKCHEFVAARDL